MKCFLRIYTNIHACIYWCETESLCFISSGFQVSSFYSNRTNPGSLADLITSAEADTSEEELVVTILPPDNATGNITDEDSGAEDGGGTINNLPGSMLRAPAVLGSEGVSDDEEEIEHKHKKAKKSKAKAKSTTGRKWIKRDIAMQMPQFSATDHNTEKLKNQNLTPSKYFELFFDDELINNIKIETNRFASQKNVDLQVTGDEIRCVLGVLLLSGYVSVPRRRMYWENLEDTHHSLIANAIRRDRFEAIFTNLHFSDNDHLDKQDKFAKVRPLTDYLAKMFLQYAPLEEFYSVDESMCEYFGKHGCKQFIHGKPIRFGFKNWCGTTTLGYLVWFDFYQGKGHTTQPDLGLGGSIVTTFAQTLLHHNKQQYHICFDNFFTSVKTVTMLKDLSVKATGTVRDNRIDKCPLENKDNMKKKERGVYDYRVDANNEVLVCRWSDNSVVNICSNAVGIEPVSTTTRYSTKEKKKIQVKQPHMVKVYNEHMGGVDRMDQNISKYRVAIRGKKWYACIVTYCIDVAINNAWQLHRICEGKDAMDLLTFRRSIARFYLQRYANPSHYSKRGRPRSSVDEARYDMQAHWVIAQSNQTRCAHCHMKTTTRCEKCDRGLHVKCFKDYHTQ